MRRLIIVVSIVTGGLGGVAAAQPPNATNWVQKPLELSGCSAVPEEGADRFAAAHDWTKRIKHRPVATGAVAHIENTRVAGGLLPTPNIAARVGDVTLGPTFMAMSYVDRDPERIRNALRRATRLSVNEPPPFHLSCPPR
jgi:hypothetical protein